MMTERTRQHRHLRTVAALLMVFLMVFTLMPAGAAAQTVNLAGVSAKFSKSVNTKILLPAKARPASLKLTAKGKKIRLDWTNVRKKGASIDGYIVVRSAGKGKYVQLAKTGKNKNYYLDSKVKKNVKYYYLVFAYKKSGSKIKISMPSPYVCGVTGNSSKKNAYSPQLNKTSASLELNKSLRLKVVYPKKAAASTTRWRSSNSKVASVSQSGVVKGKALGTATIYAKTPNGREVSCKLTVKRPTIPGPGKLSGKFYSNGGKAVLSWARAKGAASYDFRYRIKSGGKWGAWTSVNTKTLSYTLKGLKGEKLYQYQVRARKGASVSPWLSLEKKMPRRTDGTGGGSTETDYVTQSDDDTPAPGALSTVTTKAYLRANGNVDLSWAATANAKSYELQISKAGADKWTSTSTTATSYTYSGLADGQYDIRIRSVNGSKSSKWVTFYKLNVKQPAGGNDDPGSGSGSGSGNDDPGSDDPGSGSGSDDPGSGSGNDDPAPEVGAINGNFSLSELTDKTMSWNFPAAANATSYEIRYKKMGDAQWTSLPDTTERVIALTGLLPETTYYVQARGKNGSSTGPWSITWYSTTREDAATAVGKIESILTVIRRAPTELGWSFATITNAASYDIRYKAEGSDSWIEQTSTEPRVMLSGLTPGTTYRVEVRGRNGDRVGIWNYWSSTTPTE